MYLANILLFLITFLFIFGWKITSILDIVFLISCLIAFITLIILRMKVPKLIFVFTSFLLIICIYSGIVVIFHGATDIQIFLRSARTMINFIGGFSIIYLYVKIYRESFSFIVIKHIYLSITLHSLIILLMYLNSTIRNQIYNLASTMSIVNDTASISLGYRIPGLTYGLSQTSVVQMVGILLLPYLLKKNNKSIWKIFYFLSSLFIIISIFLTGRTGLLFLLILFPISLLLGNSIEKTFNPRRTLNKFLRIVIASTLLYISFSFLINFLPEYFRLYTIERAKEVTQFFTNSGDTETTAALRNMYILPTDIGTFLFGSSNLGRGNFNYINSDVGFVKLIFSSGIFGLLLMVGVYLFSIKLAMKTYILDKKLSIITLMILLSSLMLNFKELALFTRNQWSIQSLLICTCIYTLYKQKEITKKQKK